MPASNRARWLVPGLVALAAAAVAAAAMLPGAFRALPLLQPDSQTYLEWSPGRPPAYPAFLAAVRAISPQLDLLGPLQLTIFLGSVIFCALAFNRLYQRPLIALFFAPGVMLHPQLVSYAFTALPELLFASALVLHFTALLVAVRSMRPAAYVAVGLTLAVAILLKPSGYALVACLPAIALCTRAWRPFLWAATPLAAVLLLVSAVNFVKHGFFATQAQGGYSLVAHAGPLVRPVQDGEFEQATNAIAGDVEPHRQALNSIQPLDLYYVFSSHDYHVIEQIVRRRIVEDMERRENIVVTDQRQYPSDARVLREVTIAGAAIARRAIVAHPGEYARHVSAQLYGLWLLPLIESPAAIARLSADLEAVRAQSPALDRSPVAFRAVPLPVFVLVRALLFTILAAACVLPVLMLVRRAVRDLPVAYAALALHANYVLVALVQPGLPRYALVMWPAAMLVLAGAAVVVRDALSPNVRRVSGGGGR